MEVDFRILREASWDTIFNVELKTKEKIVIIISELILNEIKYLNVKLEFKNPGKEWAAFWNEKTKQWQDHTDMEFPIGDRITKFDCKLINSKLSVSIGGNHSLGFSRWGFPADQIELKMN